MNLGIPESLRAALDSRYRLERVLGMGGMASVYLAADAKHHRQVAIKVLRPDLAASIGADRFLQEIEIAARLTHPHILALHDSGESAGFLYYVMPFIEGGSLRARIDPAAPLAPAAALAIAAPVAGALAYAHRMGVLHRDIKPENILFAQGLPVVADFGIAKAISTAGGENLTRTGFPLGTPGYMSPEQAAGLTDLDPGTDVYSLAIVIYEMLVGRLPGRWPSEDAVRAGRFLEAPAAHRAVLDALPPAIEPALVRAMAIRGEQRTVSPEALLAELNGQGAQGAQDARGAQGAQDAQDARQRRAAPVAPGHGGTGAPSDGPARAKRRYSDGEVQELLRRAAELDATQPTMSGALTIGSIQQAAAEAGIDPSMVQQAARQMQAPQTPALPDPSEKPKPFSGPWWAGGPTRIQVERVVAGELSESDCAYLIEEVRTGLGHVGIVSTLGKTVSWVASQRQIGSGMGRDATVSITMRGGQTRIFIRENLGPLAGAIFGGFGGGLGGGGLGPIMGITAGALHAPMLAAIMAPLWVIGVLSGARSFYHYKSTGRQAEIFALADRLAATASALIAESALPPGRPQGRFPA